LVDVMRGHQATESPECSTEEGFAFTSEGWKVRVL